MTDVVDPATRSRMMSGIRSNNTTPELAIRKGLHSLGFRFRLHAKDVPGRPDIVLPKFKAVVMVHGCFWHGHACRYFKLPKTNTDFWRKKLSSNVARDLLDTSRQREDGWRSLIVWECAIRSEKSALKASVIRLVVEWLYSDSQCASIHEDSVLRQPCLVRGLSATAENLSNVI